MTAHPPMSLRGEIRLRDVTEDDLPIFFEQQREREANHMAAFPPRDRDAFMAHWAKIMGDETVTLKTILLDEQVAGNIVSWERDGKPHIGYWLGKNYWGKGVATKALAAFVTLVKSRPLYARVATHNIASIRVLAKCGFTVCPEETQSSEAPSDGVEELVWKLSTNEDVHTR